MIPYTESESTINSTEYSANSDDDGSEFSLGTISGIVGGGIIIIIIGGGTSLLVVFLFKKKKKTRPVGM